MRHLSMLSALASTLTCVAVRTAAGTSRAESRPYSTWMLENVISRGEGIRAADGLLSGIQKGIFQETLRAAVEWSANEDKNKEWLEYHHKSVKYNVADFIDLVANSLAPLDRLCAGRSLLFVRSTNVTAFQDADNI
jgi:MoaA/NifB/PqqE/SkfB family radical SAM enzyme